MLLVRVEARTIQGTLLSLPMGDDSNGLFISNIDGLDPVKATLVSSSFAGVDGAQYQTAHRDPRNIKIKMGVNPDYLTTTVGSLRTALYAFFMPKAWVSLRFVMDSGLYVDIVSRVESFDFPLFAKDPEGDISLMCFDPDFIDPNLVKNTYASISDLTASNESKITYPGTVETGGIFTVRPDRALNAFTVYLRPPDGTLRTMDFSVALLANDVLKISTVTGNKYALLTRAGVTSSLLYGISPQSNWHHLQNGDNYIRLYATGNPIPFDFEFNTRYGGL